MFYILWKKYKKLADSYDKHMQAAKDAVTDSPILLYEYDDSGTTFTSELSNELLIRYPEKIILVSRKHDGKRKNSVRSKETELPTKITKALEGLEGYGGGHTNASIASSRRCRHHYRQAWRRQYLLKRRCGLRAFRR